MFVPHSGRIATHVRDNRSNKLNAPLQLRQLRPAKFSDSARKPSHAPCASGGENLLAFRGRFDVRQPSIS
jgi:hypothetical protein